MRWLPPIVLLVACTPTKPGDPTGTDTDDTDVPTDTVTHTDTDTDVTTPPGTAACEVPVAADLDPAPDVVEVALTASSLSWDPGTGTAIDGLAYGGTVPGPVIDVTRGDTLRVRFTNDTDMDTTIHWHGLRVPEAMDGVDQMADPVGPGETFVYEFVVPDAGLYWYHPHMATADTVERGMYGTIRVREPDEVAPTCDLPVVLDDVLLDGAGQVEATSDMEGAMGRLGNLLLANGRIDTTVPITPGDTVLLRLVNAANARYFHLALEDHSMLVVATDGGWLTDPYVVSELVIAPGERYTVAITGTGEAGRTYALTNVREPLHDPHAMMEETDPLGDGPNPVLWLAYGAGEATSAWRVPHAEAPAFTAGPVAHHWVLDDSGMMMHDLTIDGEQYPDVPVVTVPANTPTTFEVENRSDMRHPFHLHGQRLQVLAVDGDIVSPPAWKDTFDVLPGTTVTFASQLDNPGTWLYHCHILEHADGGMAGLLVAE